MASPEEARSLRRGAEAIDPVRLEASPERRAADAEASRGFGELAARVLQRIGDRLPLALGECQGAGTGKNRCFAEALNAVLQRSESCAECLQFDAHVVRAAVLTVDRATRGCVGVQHAALWIEDD